MDLGADPALQTAPRDRAGVAVLLSTFNGERYLPEQLASLIGQSHADWWLYWRDDGSSDGTVATMAAFAAGPGAGRCRRHPDPARLRATGSFLALLGMAVGDEAGYFAFADQDDVWLKDKLAHGVAALGVLPAGQPGLYFCARALVDDRLVRLGEVLAPRRPPGFPAALTQNLAPGCCMMLNRAAAELVVACPAPEGTWHDWWCYLVVAAHGGRVIAGETPDILYRQHTANLVGEARGFWRRTLNALGRGRGPFMALFWRQVAALQAGPIGLPTASGETLAILERANRGGLWSRLRALRVPGLRRRGWAEDFAFRLWFLLG